MKRDILPVFVVVASCMLGCSQKIPDLRFETNGIAAPFVGGADALDYVLANANTMPFEYLLVGANTAYRLKRWEDATFLLYAGQIRAKFEFDKYRPTETGGNDPRLYRGFLVHNIFVMFNDEPRLRPQEYARFVDRLAAWNPKEQPGFRPDWKYKLADVPDNLATKLRTDFVSKSRVVVNLLNDPDFFEAFKVVHAYEQLLPDKQSEPEVEDHLKAAIATMRRIEHEKQVQDYFHLDDAEKTSRH